MGVVRIHQLELDCIVGLRPQEREREQRVRVELGLSIDIAQAAQSGRIALTCDYDEVAEELTAMLRFRHYHLIEMAAVELAAVLLGLHAQVSEVELRIEKPGALEGRARAASVECRRVRSDFEIMRESTAFGSVDTLYASREASLHILGIEPGQELSAAALQGERSLEWLVQGHLEHNGRVLPRHDPQVPGDRAFPYLNTGQQAAKLFRCVCPPARFASHDALQVDSPGATLGS